MLVFPQAGQGAVFQNLDTFGQKVFLESGHEEVGPQVSVFLVMPAACEVILESGFDLAQVLAFDPYGRFSELFGQHVVGLAV